MVIQDTNDCRLRIGSLSNARVGIGRAPVLNYFLSVGGTSQFTNCIVNANLTTTGNIYIY